MTADTIEKKRVAISPGKTNTLIIDSNIIPIYPVRYAYANFFDEKLVDAKEPPALSKLLNAKSIKDGNGYVVRLLREGWIYIKEEGQKHGVFHIFKYVKEEKNGVVVERFKKYLFKNRINAKNGVIEDKTGAQADGYPYIFVRKGTESIRIAYSEHEWGPETIEKINTDKEFRESCMQLVQLAAEDDPHAVKATTEHFSSLVEDYRRRQDRLLKLQSSDQNSRVEDVALDIVTTEASYELDPNSIAAELQKKTPYGKTARIVALFDPVGRQKEIAEVHAKLAVWEKDYASHNMYPFVIGQFVNDLKKVEDKDVKKIVNESINWSEHGQYWQDIETEFKHFRERQSQLAKLFEEFMMGAGQTGKVGSLDTYFKKFFCHQPAKSKAEAELQKLCEVSASIYDGMLASAPGKQAMEKIISHAADLGDDLDSSTNAFHATFELVRGIVTTPQSAFDWSIASIKAVDKFFLVLGPLWGEMVSHAEYSGKLAKRAFNKLTANSLTYISNKLIPAIMRVYGLEVKAGNKVSLTHAELARVLSQALEKSGQGKSAQTVLDKAGRKVARGQRLFDWAENVRNLKLPKLWQLAEVRVMRASGSRYSFVVPKNSVQRIGLIFDSSFAGLSAFFNALTIYNLSNQTDFDKANPLQRGHLLHSVARFTAAITALTLDTINLARSGALVVGKMISSSPLLARALAPAIKGKAQALGRFLASRMATRLIAIANFAASVTSAWDAIKAIRAGNMDEATGHIMVAIGSGILFAQAIMAAGAATDVVAGGTGSTGVGIPLAVIIALIALLLIGLGLVLVYIYGKSPFQVLLENCFWGKGSKYAFWFDVLGKRQTISEQIKMAQRIQTDHKMMLYYRMEFQEFMNFLCMPKLELDRNTPFFGYRGGERTYTYKFTLPNFQLGTSDLVCALYATLPDMSSVLDEKLTTQFKQSVKSAQIKQEKGMGIIEFNFTLPHRARLVWAYEPQPDIVVPMRLLADGGLRTNVVAGMIDEAPA